MKIKLMVFFFNLFLSTYIVTAQQNNEIDLLKKTGKAFAEVAKKTLPGVVFIEVEKTIKGRTEIPDPFFDFFGDDFFRRFFEGRGYGFQPRQYKQSGQGSGFIISKDGYILTNNHVAGDADKITVKLKDGRKFQAKLIGSDPKTEIALIKIEGDNFPYIELGDSSELEIGEWVIAIGNPFGLAETLTVGVVSAVGRSNVGITDYEDFIQTDAAINPGNSGGPLLNIEGKAVGINTAIYTRSGGYMGIGFAVPINMAKQIVNQLKEKGSVIRGFLGVQLNPQDVDEDMAKSFGMDESGGVLIAEVIPGSAAEKAGLQSGDIIVEMNGEKVKDNKSFRNAIAMMAPGTKVKFTIFRDGKKMNINAVIGKMGEGEEVIAETGSDEEGKAVKIGIKVRDVTPDLIAQYGYRERNIEGVLIEYVEAGSPADTAMLRPGMLIISINKMPVKNVGQFNKAIKEASKNKRILLKVRNPNASWFVVLRAE